ncbi:Uncharacterized protein TCM_008355 [Theobroma cacao]|uniref:Uncharacterized protein n=1 Tax=Theobroma cacao TaxID=3641 RepID=A0A061EBH8_THECC|nr:Uncharacterized protein TCM_008355 [Theobroma cacao]
MLLHTWHWTPSTRWRMAGSEELWPSAPNLRLEREKQRPNKVPFLFIFLIPTLQNFGYNNTSEERNS